jgi:hypothetical protein
MEEKRGEDREAADHFFAIGDGIRELLKLL